MLLETTSISFFFLFVEKTAIIKIGLVLSIVEKTYTVPFVFLAMTPSKNIRTI